MKRTIKSIAVFLAVITLCLSFCSCAKLEEAKENQAFFSQSEDGIIYFREKAYKPLPECDDFNIRATYNAMVTEHNVPVLLKNFYGKFFYYSEDLKFLEVGGTKYCLKELYDEYYNKIQSYQLDNYCVEDYYYDRERNRTVYEFYVLDKNAKNALDDMLNNFETAKPLGNEIYSRSILICDENAEFTRFYARLVSTTDGIYIALDDKSYDAVYYKATDEYAVLLSPYLESSDYRNKDKIPVTTVEFSN